MATVKSMNRKVQDMDSEFFGPITDFQEQEAAQEAAEYSWERQDYKIYPSSLKTIDMCPKEFVEEVVHSPLYFQYYALEAMETGDEIHKSLQTTMLRMPDYLAKPDYAYYGTLYPEHLAKALEKLEKYWPEVPIYDPIAGVSLRMDGVKQRGSYKVIEIKSIGVENTQWVWEDKEKTKGKWETGCWDKEKKKLPTTAHKMQAAFYLYYCNLFKLYPPMKQAIFCYQNTKMKDRTAKYEVPFTLTDQMSMMISVLLEDLTKHRNAWLDGKTKVECTYKYCKEHRI